MLTCTCFLLISTYQICTSKHVLVTSWKNYIQSSLNWKHGFREYILCFGVTLQLWTILWLILIRVNLGFSYFPSDLVNIFPWHEKDWEARFIQSDQHFSITSYLIWNSWTPRPFISASFALCNCPVLTTSPYVTWADQHCKPGYYSPP